MEGEPEATSVILRPCPGRLLLSSLAFCALISNNGCGHAPEPTPFTALRTDYSSQSAIGPAAPPFPEFQPATAPDWQQCENLHRSGTGDQSRAPAGDGDLILIVSTLAAPGTMSQFEISIGATPAAPLTEIGEASGREVIGQPPGPDGDLAADNEFLANDQSSQISICNAVAAVSRESGARSSAERETSTALAIVPALATASRRWLELPCPVPGSDPERNASQAYRWTPVSCRAVLTGDRVRVWSPEHESDQAADRRGRQELLQLVEHELLPRIEQDQGTWPDIDDDGFINLLVTESVSRLDPTLKAFVRRQSFQSRGRSQSGAPLDLIYVGQGATLSHLRPILLHELTHLIEFSWCQQLCADQPWPMPDWLTEGLAHAAEMRCDSGWSNVGNRLTAFAARPALSPLVVMDSAASGLWRDPQQRGATAAFCYWWQQRHPGIHWSQLIAAFQTADDPWEAVCGESFPDLYRQWTISLAVDGVPVGGDGLRTPVPMRSLSPSRPVSVTLRGTASAWFRIPRGAVSLADATVLVRGLQQQQVQLTLMPWPQTATAINPTGSR